MTPGLLPGFPAGNERYFFSISKTKTCVLNARQIFSCQRSRLRQQSALAASVRSRFYGQATKGVCVDALAQVGEEGRGQLR